MESQQPVTIIRATKKDAVILVAIGKQTFIESHGRSADKIDIDSYVHEKYNEGFFKKELAEPANIYHLLYFKEKLAGYSKIIFNCRGQNIAAENIAKLERLYLLQEYHGLHLGQQLFNFNIELAKSNHQSGIWLFVWKENNQAISFYSRNGFQIIGSYDFHISATHVNPNHQMLLKF